MFSTLCVVLVFSNAVWSVSGSLVFLLPVLNESDWSVWCTFGQPGISSHLLHQTYLDPRLEVYPFHKVLGPFLGPLLHCKVCNISDSDWHLQCLCCIHILESLWDLHCIGLLSSHCVIASFLHEVSVPSLSQIRCSRGLCFSGVIISLNCSTNPAWRHSIGSSFHFLIVFGKIDSWRPFVVVIHHWYWSLVGNLGVGSCVCHSSPSRPISLQLLVGIS